MWRNLVEEVVHAAERIKGKADSVSDGLKTGHLQQPTPQVVVFIDELNTAPKPVLAMIKECFVDGAISDR